MYKAEIGTTVLVASMREDGQTFSDNLMPGAECKRGFSPPKLAERVPSRSSMSSKFIMVVDEERGCCVLEAGESWDQACQRVCSSVD